MKLNFTSFFYTLGGEEGSIPLFLGNLDKAALDKVPYKVFMESKKLDLGCGVPDPVALYSDSADFEVSLNQKNRNLG